MLLSPFNPSFLLFTLSLPLPLLCMPLVHASLTPSRCQKVRVGVCTVCAPGSYSTTQDATACTPCGAGNTTWGGGHSSPDKCAPCPAGTYLQ